MYLWQKYFPPSFLPDDWVYLSAVLCPSIVTISQLSSLHLCLILGIFWWHADNRWKGALSYTYHTHNEMTWSDQHFQLFQKGEIFLAFEVFRVCGILENINLAETSNYRIKSFYGTTCCPRKCVTNFVVPST